MAAERPPLDMELHFQRKRRAVEEVFGEAKMATTELATTPYAWELWLDMQARLPSLSAVNAILLYSQRSLATELKSARQWEVEGKSIKDRTRPIRLLEETMAYVRPNGQMAVFYEVVEVYDAAQTSAGSVRESENADFAVLPPERSRLRALIRASPVPVTTVSEGGEAAADFLPKQGVIQAVRGRGIEELFFWIAYAEAKANLWGMEDGMEDCADFISWAAAWMVCRSQKFNPEPYRRAEAPEMLEDNASLIQRTLGQARYLYIRCREKIEQNLKAAENQAAGRS